MSLILFKIKPIVLRAGLLLQLPLWKVLNQLKMVDSINTQRNRLLSVFTLSQETDAVEGGPRMYLTI